MNDIKSTIEKIVKSYGIRVVDYSVDIDAFNLETIDIRCHINDMMNIKDSNIQTMFSDLEDTCTVRVVLGNIFNQILIRKV